MGEPKGDAIMSFRKLPVPRKGRKTEVRKPDGKDHKKHSKRTRH